MSFSIKLMKNEMNENENLITDNCCYSCFNHFFNFTTGIANHENHYTKKNYYEK